MSGVALALAGACLLVTPYTVLAAQRAGSTVQNPSAATQVAPSYFPIDSTGSTRSRRSSAWMLGG